MLIKLKTSDRSYEFQSEEGQRLLYAGLAEGICLPYECASGTCGECKATVLDGEIESLWADAPGTACLNKEKQVLLCQSAAKTDCTLSVGKLRPADQVPRHGVGLISEVEWLTHDVVSFSMQLDGDLAFDAGQFLALRAPGLEGYRSYSMVHAKAVEGKLSFVVKKKPGGGFSTWLFDNDVIGQKVVWFGPLGRATFVDPREENLIFIAGGTGIAGFMAILETASAAGHFREHDGEFFFGVRSFEDAFFLPRLAEFAEKEAPRLRITVALSHAEVPNDASKLYPNITFEAGFVHDVASRILKKSNAKVAAYVAGPVPLVNAATRFLILQLGLSPLDIKFDKFG